MLHRHNMPDIQARVNKLTEEVRCGLPDCGALLFKGKVNDAKIRIKCKCGVFNIIAAQQHKPESPGVNGKRMNVTTKAGK